jgi:hypothetical protein
MVLLGLLCACSERALPLVSHSPDRAQTVDLGAPPDLSVAGDLADPCAGLDASACKQRPECVADVCLICSCPEFVGCRLQSAKMTACPNPSCPVGLPHCCRGPNDCAPPTTVWVCLYPGESYAGCGTCKPVPPCSGDPECAKQGQHLICAQVSCNCNATCVPDCTSTGCKLGEACGPDGRCAATGCALTSQCPPNFYCDPIAKACVRRLCSSDSDCDGYCLGTGYCYDGFGLCKPIPPP